ncbi:ATP-dependent dethiobiotin synthetase BioD [Streptococcus gallolyticus]|uniref:ATP-dependent dethiobiotin synthetase BioD n=1 Tax=Streptococcus gallolyticus TaxID=315405 RepID=UPI00398FD7CA
MQLEHIVQQIIKQVEFHSLSPVIIEMAGGIMSPINQKQSMLDIVKAVNLPVILVVSSYLGSLNHTLLTLKVLQSEGIDIFGIIFNQVRTVEGIITDSNEYIKNLTELPILGYIPYLNDYKQRMKSENDKNRLIKNWRV